MVAWQKRARMFVLFIAAGVAAVVFFTTRSREALPPPTPVERGDPSATVESSGAFLTQVKGERETVRVEAEKQYSYPDGSMRLIKVRVTSVRQGKTFVAIADEARVGENQTNLDMKGNVVMTSSDGLEAKGSSAAYNQGEGIVRAPGPVTFKRGRMSGSGVDFSYDETRDLMGLSDQSKVQLAPPKAGGETTDITSGAAVLARADKFVSFERAVHIVRGSQVIDAESALGELSENQEHLTGLELSGSARIETPNAAPGGLRLMSGDVINLTYYDSSDLLQSAIVTGGAALRIAADKGADESVLHADNIEIGMAPDGTTLTSLNGRDHVVFDIAAAGKGQPAKKVTSSALVASGADGKGLTSASFTEGVEYQETGGTPPVKRTVTSRTLDTSLKGGLGQIQEATFIGSARFRDPPLQAAGSTMRYNLETGQVALTGASGEPVPRVVNEQIQVDATNIDMNIEGSKMRAYGEARRVQSIMFPAKPGAKGSKTPGLMKQDQPVNGVSGALAYTGGDDAAIELTGSAMLVQGDKSETQVKGEKISIDGKTGNLQAQGSVIAQMLVQDLNPETKVKETTRSTGYGQQMQYRRRDAQDHLHHQSASRRTAGGFDRRDDRAHIGIEWAGHRAARGVWRSEVDRGRSHYHRRGARVCRGNRGIQCRWKGTVGAHVSQDGRRRLSTQPWQCFDLLEGR